MNPRSLTRSSERVLSTLVENGDQLITTTGCKLYIPTRFVEKGLIQIGNETYITMLYAMVVDDKYYSVSNVPARGRIEPTEVNTLFIEEEDYYEFVFAPGAVVIANVNLVSDKNILFDIHEEIIGKGKVPWYLTYNDLGKLFTLAPRYAGGSVGANHAVREMIVSIIARDHQNPVQFYRQSPDLGQRRPFYVPFKSVAYGASNTTAKLMGAYWNEGLTSALVNPTDRVEAIEEILRR